MTRKRASGVLFCAMLLALIGGGMARGSNDWNVDTGARSLFVPDPVEAIMRAGVPGPFLRSGRVVYADSFEASLVPWQVITGVGYGTAELDADYAFRGAQCLRMTPAAVNPQRTLLQKPIPYVITGKVGIEAVVWGEDAADQFFVGLGVRSDNVFTYYYFYLFFADTTLSYLSSSDTVEDVATYNVDTGGGTLNFQLMKLVIDPLNDQYSYIQLNNDRYDLTGIQGYSFANSGPDYVIALLRAADTSGDQGIVRVDDVVVTMDEP
jgi:hypothetical protein